MLWKKPKLTPEEQKIVDKIWKDREEGRGEYMDWEEAKAYLRRNDKCQEPKKKKKN